MAHSGFSFSCCSRAGRQGSGQGFISRLHPAGEEIVEARSTLEVKLAELAAARRTDDDVKAIDQALQVIAPASISVLIGT
ncbi:FCD domain-containing protein [Arthrobacter sp. ZGTC412]|uniref:FCD domain-containing protein n=1 Tax=Arthrobacter sp. ZGTC412 TaxID=2058900 RepID=UPI0035A0D283